MISTELPVELQITKYISEQKTKILELIDTNQRILLQANPGSGKTHFFEEIAKDILSDKRNGRLIFVAPFLIITEQFANKVNVDLQLKSGSRKELLPTDKIITSTFQSLKHIANELDQDDIIVIDEAHALFYSYLKTNNERQFYLSTIQDLYHTKAKVVLMSGTPNLNLVRTLRLHHIKITKNNEIKAKININFSKARNLDIAKEFALNTMNEYGKNSLNVIYIKSIKECNNISDMLNNLGYNAKVLTSFEKNESTYKSISDIELVPEGIQFIVTTNVISTGANIKNANIGSALILDEFSANEIKQFSKRFRNKPEIEIEVVNKPFITKGGFLNLAKIAKQRKYINDTLEYYRTCLNKIDYNFDLDYSYNKENQELITPVDSINRILDLNLRQESLFIDKAVDSIDTADDLADLLNEYDDIEAEVISDYKEIETSQSKNSDTAWDSKTKDLIEDFMKYTNAYISAMRSKYNQDWSSRNRIKNLTRDELKNDIFYSNKIRDNINSVIFLKEILPIFLTHRSAFKNTKDFLKYLSKKSSKTQSILPTTLLLNDLFLDYYGVIRVNTTIENNLSLELKDIKNFKNLSIENQVLLLLIKKTFDFCVFKENVQITDLRIHLEKDKEIIEKIIGIKIFEKIDSNLLNIKPSSFSFANDNLLKSLVNSIFLSETKRLGTKKTTSVTFKNLLPSGYLSKKLNCNKQVITHYQGEEKIEIILGTRESIDKSIKFLNSYDLILEEFE